MKKEMPPPKKFRLSNPFADVCAGLLASFPVSLLPNFNRR